MPKSRVCVSGDDHCQYVESDLAVAMDTEISVAGLTSLDSTLTRRLLWPGQPSSIDDWLRYLEVYVLFKSFPRSCLG